MKKIFYAGLMSVVLGTQVLSGTNVFANANGVEATAEKKLQNTVIRLQGRDIQAHKYKGFDLVVDRSEMKLKVKDVMAYQYPIHDGFYGNKYIEIELKGANGERKGYLRLNGTTRTDKAKDPNGINGVSFEYGDTLEIFHAEGKWHRFQIVEGGSGNLRKSKNYTFVITKDGLVQK